ncbi:PEP-CTERM sorting domain-containing protein [Cellvibrio sp. OA-2007]|uniref:PEP-CTERM sorting domain-containing protein n=1 Tax=Cellvibrio sp. OA-2007 TaxID=529823 RepID=UPI0007855FB7|nr:PEP-CTERM sorting domain-containing protein [Cellvibrio sp. OA-2007]
MKNLFNALLLPLLLATGAAHALPIITLSNVGEVTTSVAGATTIDFNSGCGYATCSGDFALVVGSQSGKYAQPLGVNSQYLTVPKPSPTTKSATFTLGTTADYFGLFWGSIDSYNFISFYLNNALVASYSGRDIVGQFANGNQLSYSSNRYINFNFGTGAYDSVTLASTGFAFESDNHAFKKLVSVTEPTTALLFLMGLVGLALARRQVRISHRD